jgi:hypothetical protein
MLKGSALSSSTICFSWEAILGEDFGVIRILSSSKEELKINLDNFTLTLRPRVLNKIIILRGNAIQGSGSDSDRIQITEIGATLNPDILLFKE